MDAPHGRTPCRRLGGVFRAQEHHRVGEDDTGPGQSYCSQHELIFAFKNGDAPTSTTSNSVSADATGPTYGPMRVPIRSALAGMDDLAMHPTMKPVALVADAMRDCSRRGDVVLDPFIGSGTTIMAAERVGRRAYGIEIDPRYVDVAVRRWSVREARTVAPPGSGRQIEEIHPPRLAARPGGHHEKDWASHAARPSTGASHSVGYASSEATSIPARPVWQSKGSPKRVEEYRGFVKVFCGEILNRQVEMRTRPPISTWRLRISRATKCRYSSTLLGRPFGLPHRPRWN